jgi:hypothetical protein
MEIIFNGDCNLHFINNRDIRNNIFTDRKYILLLQVNTNEEIMKIENNIINILNENCHEIYSIGKYSEEIHEMLDNYIIDKKIKDNSDFFIITTSDNEANIKEICFYFLEIIREINCKDYYALINDKNIKKKIKNYFLNIKKIR